MKYLISSLLVFLLSFTACDLVTESNPPVENVLNKQLIKLPPRSGLWVENTFSVTETIDGDKGGEIRLHEQYVDINGETVKIDAKLKIKKHAFQGVVDITLTADDEYAAISFTPAMVFDKPAELDLKFEGIDLGELNLTEGDYDFVFVGDDGRIEVVEYNALHVDESKSKIWVTKADLNHFSRYGFVN
jgi:hypothetical protein